MTPPYINFVSAGIVAPSGWDISASGDTGNTYDASAQATGFGSQISFSPDGLNMYVMSTISEFPGYTYIFQYSLGIAWDITTATYTGNSFKFLYPTDGSFGQSNTFFFKYDGSKIYIAMQPAGGLDMARCNVLQYSLGTSWDITTITYDGVLYNVSAQAGGGFAVPFSMFLSPDGLNMYVGLTAGAISSTVFQYTLSVAWNVSTATYSGYYLEFSGTETNPASIFFSPDGINLFVLGLDNNELFQFSLSPSWDISTASQIAAFPYPITSPSSVFFKSDGTSFFTLDGNFGANIIYQYTS